MMPALRISYRPARYSRSGRVSSRAGSISTAQRLMEAADQVLAADQVDAGLAADGRVHLGQQRGGDLEHRDAAHEDGRQEAGHVVDDAAAEGDHHAGAVAAQFDHALRQLLHGLQALVLFAAGQEQDLVRNAGERALQLRGPCAARRPRWRLRTVCRPWAAGSPRSGPGRRAPRPRSSCPAGSPRDK